MHILKILLIISVLGVTGCKNKSSHVGSDVRPEDFPDFLFAPNNARDIIYLSPLTGGIVEHSYSIYYYVDEPYPPAQTIQYIHELLSHGGFQRLEHLLDDPLNKVGQWRPTRVDRDGFEGRQWRESWISDNDESVNVRLSRHHPIVADNPEVLEVHMLYHTHKSYWKNLIEQYRELYPNEFKDSDAAIDSEE